MKKAAALVIAGVLLGACGAPARVARTNGTPPRAAQRERRTIEIYAAVVRQLVTKDHTFGGAPSPFDHVYIVDGAVKGAGDPMKGDERPDRPFGDKVKAGLRRELADIPPVDFVSDPDSVRLGKNGMDGVENDGAIITLAPIAGGGDRTEVSNSLWCGGLCGQWLTYVVKLEGDVWRVSGTTGPYAIS